MLFLQFEGFTQAYLSNEMTSKRETWVSKFFVLFTLEGVLSQLYVTTSARASMRLLLSFCNSSFKKAQKSTINSHVNILPTSSATTQERTVPSEIGMYHL